MAANLRIQRSKRRRPIPTSDPGKREPSESRAYAETLGNRPFQLAEFRVDPELNRVCRGQEETRITPRTMEVLLALGSRAGEVMSRDEIFDQVWGDVIVGDEALTRCVADLRKAFGDTPSAARYIRTIPKKGYCLVPDPEPLPGRQGVLERLWRVSPENDRSFRGRRFRPLVLGVLAATLVAALAAGYSQLVLDPESPLAARPLTTYPGVEIDPRLDQQGERVVYARRHGPKHQLDLFVQDIASGKVLQITDDAASDFSPSWSPEGNRIAFIRTSQGGCEFVIRQLADSHERVLGSCGNNPTSDLIWSPSGEWLAYTDRKSDGEPFGIYLIDPHNGDRHLLVQPDGEHWGDKVPAFSPDGTHIAFVRSVGLGAQDLFVIPTTGGNLRRVTREAQTLGGHTWSSDGENLIYSSLQGGHWGLWRVPIAGGEPVWLPLSSYQPRAPHMAPEGNRLVFEDDREDLDLVSVGVSSTSGSPLPTIDSTRLDLFPQQSPSGRRMVFVSDRSGNRELWLKDREGVHRLTHLKGNFTGPPRWSPGEDSILFDNRAGPESHLFLVGVNDAKVRQLTHAGSSNLFPSYSRDGRFIYFGSNRSGRWQVWKMPAEGGPAVQITSEGGYGGQESADGRWLYFCKFNRPGLWALSLESGQESFLNSTLRLTDRTHWGSHSRGLYFIRSGAQGRELARLPAPGEEVEILSHLGDIDLGPGFSLDADADRLLLSQARTWEQDVILIEVD